MRVAFYTLHYGKEYLAWSIRSIQDAVDKIIVVYAPEPSFGFGNRPRGRRRHVANPNPDTEADLRREAERFATKPIIWESGSFRHEGAHRDHGLALARQHGAELMLVVDADEIWDPQTAVQCLDYVKEKNCAGRWMANFANFFRSWKYMVHDHFTPIRIVDMRHPLTVDAMLEQTHPVYHFGYAQCDAIMRYKWTIHGHQRELRPGWIDRFISWQPSDTDLHPTSIGLWDKAHETPPEILEKIRELMPDHPYADLEVIR